MFQWLSRGDLKAETESDVIAAQDQVLQTKYSITYTLQTQTANAGYVNNLTTNRTYYISMRKIGIRVVRTVHEETW